MAQKILSLTVLVTLVALAGAGCKKDAGQTVVDEKSYLTDQVNPLGGTKPGTDEEGKKDPCLQKGALGAQALMLKTDCNKVTPAVCGNKVKETGEGCDDGNTKDGDGCSSKCTPETTTTTKPTTTPGGGGKLVKITTTSMPDKSLGSKYSATVKASGSKIKKDYKWIVTDLPDGFEYKADDATLTISSKVLTTKTGTFKPSVQVCLLSDPADCATCPEEVCSFSIQEHYRVEAFPMGKDYGGGKDIKAFCSSDPDTPCGNYELKVTDFLPTATNTHNLTNKDDPYYVLKLWVKDGSPQIEPVSVPPADEKDKSKYKWDDPTVGFAEDYSKLYYKWSMTVDENTPVPFVKWVDYVTKKKADGTWNSLDTKAQNSIFLMDATDDMKSTLVYPSMAYIMVGPDAMGQTFKNVVVTVTSANGGSQTIKFPLVKMPSLKEIGDHQEQVAAQKKKEQDDKCAAFGIESIDYAGQILKPTADGKTNDATDAANHFLLNTTIATLRSDQNIKIKWKGGTPPYKISGFGQDSGYNTENVARITQAQVVVQNGDNWTMFVPQDAGDAVYDPKTTTMKIPKLNHTLVPEVVGDLLNSQFPGIAIMTVLVGEGGAIANDAPKEWRDMISFSMKDSDPGCKSKFVTINRNATYPDPREYKLGNVKQFKVAMKLDDLDGDSKVTYRLQGDYHKELATSGEIKVESVWCDGEDDCSKTKDVNFQITDDVQIKDVKNVHIVYDDPGSGGYMDVWPSNVTLELEEYQISFGMGSPDIECSDSCEKDISVTPVVIPKIKW